ncbi:MAG: DUF424 family protein [Theionarchaea archaeon]|nr:DUF424 family protein [Theionarchaea archaeon]MBU7038069.1 DUF424 family protein [Theionarchaea archaeon]
MDVFVRMFRTGTETLVAGCDAELAGRTFQEDDLYLEVKEDFYCGECITLDASGAFLLRATILNLVGEKIVGKAVELGLVDPENVLQIGETVHAQMVRL